MRKITAIALCIYFVTACTKVPDVASGNFVVEAYLFSGETVNDITLKTLVPLSDPEGDSEIINSGLVTITKNGALYQLAFDPSTSKYFYSGTDLNITPEDVLELVVDVNGRIATAITVVPTAPTGIQRSKSQMVIPTINSAADFIGGNPLADAEIIVNWNNPDEELMYAVIEFRSNLLRPILPSDVQEVVDGILEDFAIITVPSTDTTLTVLGALLPSYGPYIIKVYKVNQEYADLYESETQDSRDLNDPPSNIINARGIFSAFASDSIAFEVVKP